MQTRIRQIASEWEGGKGSLIGLLQRIQLAFNYVPPISLPIVAERLGLPLGQVCGVATFYGSFSLEPRGRHMVTCCLGTACHVRGGAKIVDEVSDVLAIGPGDTTEDLLFTFETVRCLGACALAPVVVIDGKYYGKSRPRRIRRILQDIRAREEAGVEQAS
ncbi:MAG: NAD(P)H-dependent oxidoreductase subunit E [Phycisphaerae bacterium]|nr:NAD(P)H-dependent oxidoreductase subunit E [Phycisphaerae bacterium]